MNRPVAQVGDGDTLQSWFNDIPIITKILFVSTILSGAGLSFGWLSAEPMVLIWPKVIHQFQVWRIFSAFIYAGSFSFNFAMHTYVLYENSRRYESNPYNTGAGGNSADYLWMLLFAMTILLAVSYIFDMFVLSEPLLYVILYTWSRREPTAQLSMFGIRFKSVYLPWAYVAIRMIMGGSITQPLLGIAVGHLYYFLVEVMPVSHNYRLIHTPRFCSSAIAYLTGLSPANNAGNGFFAAAPARAAAPAAAAPTAAAAGGDGLRQRNPANARPAAYTWGQGRALGTQ